MLSTIALRSRAAQAFARGSSRRSPPPPPRVPQYVYAIVGGTVAVGGLTYYSFLDYAPYTNRRRWIATSPEFESSLGDQEYQNLMKQFRSNILPPSHRASQTLHRVGKRITDASIEFSKLYPSAASRRPYTYTVVRSEMANAFVLPGNHVFLFTGLLEYIHDEDELAIILAHECSHNLARHVGEKISGSVVVTTLARMSLLFDPSGVLFAILLPAASLFRELPNSRVQEQEADEIGLQLVTLACYDPRAARRVFSNMRAEKGPPEFLSTHPSHATRIKKFDTLIPEAMSRQDHERCRRIRQKMQRARQEAAVDAHSRESVRHG